MKLQIVGLISWVFLEVLGNVLQMMFLCEIHIENRTFKAFPVTNCCVNTWGGGDFVENEET